MQNSVLTSSYFSPMTFSLRVLLETDVLTEIVHRRLVLNHLPQVVDPRSHINTQRPFIQASNRPSDLLNLRCADDDPITVITINKGVECHPSIRQFRFRDTQVTCNLAPNLKCFQQSRLLVNL
jgi:hypothetical protein